MDEILRMYKELRVINCGNITDRLQEATDGDMFIVYNTIRDTYEIHSVTSFKHNGMSCNTSIDEDKLNQELIEIIKSCSIKRFGNDIQSDRSYINMLLDNNENKKSESLFLKGKKMIELSLGREV